MPYTPLVPLPSSSDDNMPDPLEELLRPSASSSSDSKPMFSPRAPRRTMSQPINIPKTTGSTSASHVNATAIMTPPSASSEFGAFVSVPPSHDPLGVAISPRSQSFSPANELFSGTDTMTFAEAAKRRTEDNERRIMDELLIFEEDPTSLIKKPANETSNGAIVIDLSPDHASPNEEIAAVFSATAPHRPKLSDRLASSLEEAMSTPSPHERDTLGELRVTSASRPLNTNPRDMTSSGDTSNYRTGSLPKSSSFSYLSNTLPRTWSNLLRSPSSSSLATSHYRPVHAATVPVVSHLNISPAQSSPGLTHDSPFAAHPYIPPSGAPG